MPYEKEQLVQKLYEAGIILQQGDQWPNGFLLKSGKWSDIYINLRDLIRTPTTFNIVMYSLFQLIFDTYNKTGACVLGIPTMGAVIAPIMAYKLSLPQAVRRQRSKLHGVGNEIEGELSKKVLLIDDVITSGKSIREVSQDVIEPVYDQDYQLDTYVIVDREQHDVKNVKSLLTLSEIRKWKPKQ